MAAKRATIKDIAREAGVSPATVSRALSDHSSISKATRLKIAEIARQLNYRPNLQAKSLRTHATKTIALILPEINSFFVPEMMYGINTAAAELGFSVMMFQSDNQLAREKELLWYATELSADGILLSLSEETESLEHVQQLRDSGTPLLLIDKTGGTTDIPSLTIDGAAAAADAVRHLLDKGHRQIGGVFGHPALSITQNRRSGYLRALDAAGLSETDCPTLEVSQILEISTNLHRFLNDYPGLTALFLMSDELMVHTHHELSALGIRIPEQLSLIAISDGIAPYYLHPNITHLHHSGYGMGYEAARMLITHITQRPTPANPAPLQGAILPTKRCELHSVRQI
ncbi:transcriptional regulator, LacI family [Cyclonatronum proteinivorum]|uniref:Transcriptional regulator, LacI family n=1 Tax=Cyclonatronum proteinivorum TaxID=1457365 RepID=A0A345UM91_9BACT|nr:LacI family DNA-binding transcriptional regulator [Cyclonatronum proteinivorum]AXJ01593.1 transcriptional regulator, LacI family [Cyclonatronum proteinivorum]